MIALDHVCYTLAALHPGLHQLGEHLEDPLAWTGALLLQDGWGYAAEFESKVALLPVPPPLLEIHSLNFRTERLVFDGCVVRLIREADGRR